jgi:hypothetical protein
VRQHLLTGAGQLARRADLQRVRVNDDVLARLDLDIAVALDRQQLVRRVEHDLVLLRAVDDRHLLRAVLVLERDAVTLPRLEHLRVVLARVVALRRLLLLVPQRADHDRTVDVAVLEHDEDLIFFFRQQVRAAIVAGHRHRDARPERLLVVVQPRELQLHAEARVVGRIVLVLDDDRDPAATDLAGAKRRRHHAIDRQERHAMSIFGAS